jgi:hypothetical protein
MYSTITETIVLTLFDVTLVIVATGLPHAIGLFSNVYVQIYEDTRMSSKFV